MLRVGKVGFCGAIFEVFEIKSKAKILVYNYSRPYLKNLKSGEDSRFKFISARGHI